MKPDKPDLSFVGDWVAQHADPFDGHFHYVASRDWSDPLGCTGGDQVTGV
jgi:hypothetical protein